MDFLEHKQDEQRIQGRRTPRVRVIRRWTAHDVRGVCCECDFYTAGDNEAYGKMLACVSHTEPTPDQMYVIAKDIKDHSRTQQSITSIMYLLEKHAVTTTFELYDE